MLEAHRGRELERELQHIGRMQVEPRRTARHRAAAQEIHRHADARQIEQALERRLHALARVLGRVAEDAARHDVVVGLVGDEGERVADQKARAGAGKALAAALDHRPHDVHAGVARLDAARVEPRQQVAEAAADVEQPLTVEVAEAERGLEALLLG